MPKPITTAEVVMPFSDAFTPVWDLWKQYKKELFKFQYKSNISEQSALNRLVRISGGSEEMAVEIIEYSMSSQWEGLYVPKTNNFLNGKATSGAGAGNQRESLNEALNKRFAGGK